MQVFLTEAEELSNMRDNVRRSVNALELCWACQRIAECEQGVVDDGGPVWLCRECFLQLRGRQQSEPGALFWPTA